MSFYWQVCFQANAPVDISADENAADYIRIKVEGTVNDIRVLQEERH